MVFRCLKPLLIFEKCYVIGLREEMIVTRVTSVAGVLVVMVEVGILIFTLVFYCSLVTELMLYCLMCRGLMPPC